MSFVWAAAARFSDLLGLGGSSSRATNWALFLLFFEFASSNFAGSSDDEVTQAASLRLGSALDKGERLWRNARF